MTDTTQKQQDRKAAFQAQIEQHLKNYQPSKDSITELSALLADELLSMIRKSHHKRSPPQPSKLKKLVDTSLKTIGNNQTRELFQAFAVQHNGQSIYFPKPEKLNKLLN